MAGVGGACNEHQAEDTARWISRDHLRSVEPFRSADGVQESRLGELPPCARDEDALCPVGGVLFHPCGVRVAAEDWAYIEVKAQAGVSI